MLGCFHFHMGKLLPNWMIHCAPYFWGDWGSHHHAGLTQVENIVLLMLILQMTKTSNMCLLCRSFYLLFALICITNNVNKGYLLWIYCVIVLAIHLWIPAVLLLCKHVRRLLWKAYILIGIELLVKRITHEKWTYVLHLPWICMKVCMLLSFVATYRLLRWIGNIQVTACHLLEIVASHLHVMLVDTGFLWITCIFYINIL